MSPRLAFCAAKTSIPLSFVPLGSTPSCSSALVRFSASPRSAFCPSPSDWACQTELKHCRSGEGACSMRSRLAEWYPSAAQAAYRCFLPFKLFPLPLRGSIRLAVAAIPSPSSSAIQFPRVVFHGVGVACDQGLLIGIDKETAPQHLP